MAVTIDALRFDKLLDIRTMSSSVGPARARVLEECAMSVVFRSLTTGNRAVTGWLALALALAVAMPAAAQGRDVKFYPATITFTDSPTSSSLTNEVRLTNSGTNKTYTGATIVTADSANLNIDLSKSTRRFSVTLRDGAVGVGPLPAGTGPGSGVTYLAGTQLNVYGVRTIPIFSSAIQDMAMTVDEIKRGYRLRFSPNAAGIGTKVCVTRTEQTKWTVSSLRSGESCGVDGGLGAGETTRLIDSSKSGNPLVGTYVMPFSFEVECPTCPQ